MENEYKWFIYQRSTETCIFTDLCTRKQLFRKIKKELKNYGEFAIAYLLDKNGQKAIIASDTKSTDILDFN